MNQQKLVRTVAIIVVAALLLSTLFASIGWLFS